MADLRTALSEKDLKKLDADIDKLGKTRIDSVGQAETLLFGKKLVLKSLSAEEVNEYYVHIAHLKFRLEALLGRTSRQSYIHDSLYFVTRIYNDLYDENYRRRKNRYVGHNQKALNGGGVYTYGADIVTHSGSGLRTLKGISL